MPISLIDQIEVSELSIISSDLGSVMHVLKKSDKSFSEFGEIYISTVNLNHIKAWKQHKIMKMNLIVPVGKVKFVFYDIATNRFREETIGTERYVRLTVPPKLWFGFKGLDSTQNLIINISNIVHNPDEQLREDVNSFKYNW